MLKNSTRSGIYSRVLDMKKEIAGLVGIVLGCCGCSTQGSYNEVINNIRGHYSEINRLAEAMPGDSCVFVDAAKKGEPVSIIINGKEGQKIVIFYDKDKDGSYETKSIITAPNKLDIQIIPPAPKPQIKRYTPSDKRRVAFYGQFIE